MTFYIYRERESYMHDILHIHVHVQLYIASSPGHSQFSILTLSVHACTHVLHCRFHHLLITEGEDVDFWEFLRDFSERIFLVPTPPVGHLAVVSGLVCVCVCVCVCV